jgi:hypothetical protein
MANIHTLTRDGLINQLRAFIESRPGFESANYYGAPEAYRQDTRRALRDLHDARSMLRVVVLSGMPVDLLVTAIIGGRLTIEHDGEITYTPGQYYCIEYRAAACRALMRAIVIYYAKGTTRDDQRASLRPILDAGLIRRWF